MPHVQPGSLASSKQPKIHEVPPSKITRMRILEIKFRPGKTPETHQRLLGCASTSMTRRGRAGVEKLVITRFTTQRCQFPMDFHLNSWVVVLDTQNKFVGNIYICMIFLHIWQENKLDEALLLQICCKQVSFLAGQLTSPICIYLLQKQIQLAYPCTKIESVVTLW